MSTSAASQDVAQDDTTRLDSLPQGVLARCVRSDPGAAGLATFATNKTLAKALLYTAKKPCFTVQLANRDQESFQSFCSIMQWAAPLCSNLELVLSGEGAEIPVNIHPLLDQLQQTVGSLPTVTRAEFRSLVLDALPPASLAAVLPNLRQLELWECGAPPTSLLLAGCNQLTQLQLWGCHPSTASPAAPLKAWLPQLQQLTSLPALSALNLDVTYYPTSFLPLLAGQLTSLRLTFSGEPSWLRAQTSEVQLRWSMDLRGAERRAEPDQRWEAGLAAAAQCTSLQQMTVPARSGHELSILATLPQLQQLVLFNACFDGDETDDCIHALLGLPSLTRLYWGYTGGKLQQSSYADSPCSWQQLVLRDATPGFLSRLPLHSLTQPLQLQQLTLDPINMQRMLADLPAAAVNLARMGAVPRVASWQGKGTLAIHFLHEEDESDDDDEDEEGESDDDELEPNPAPLPPSPYAALLRAAAALLPQDIKELELWHAEVDAQLVVALQEVVPTIPRITLAMCLVLPSFWDQLADLFPQLKELKLYLNSVESVPLPIGCFSRPDPPSDLCTAGAISYYTAAHARHTGAGLSGVPPAANISSLSYDKSAVQEEAQRQLQAAVGALGLQAKVIVREPIGIEMFI